MWHGTKREGGGELRCFPPLSSMSLSFGLEKGLASTTVRATSSDVRAKVLLTQLPMR